MEMNQNRKQNPAFFLLILIVIFIGACHTESGHEENRSGYFSSPFFRWKRSPTNNESLETTEPVLDVPPAVVAVTKESPNTGSGNDTLSLKGGKEFRDDDPETWAERVVDPSAGDSSEEDQNGTSSTIQGRRDIYVEVDMYHGHHARKPEPDDTVIKCNSSYKVYKHPDATFIVQSKFFGTRKQYPPKECKWILKGSKRCILEFQCHKVDIREDCTEEYLAISDNGNPHASVRLCKKTSMLRSVQPNRGKDLEIYFHTLKSKKFDRFYKGFQCKVRCADDSEIPVPLPVPVPQKPSPPKIKGEYDVCNMGKEHSIAKSRKIVVTNNLDTYEKQMETESTCTVYISGDQTCRVQATCEQLDLQSRNCETEYVKLYDRPVTTFKNVQLCHRQDLKKPFLSAPLKNNGILLETKTKGGYAKSGRSGVRCTFECKPGAKTTTTATTKAPPPKIDIPKIQLCSKTKRHELGKGKRRLIVQSLKHGSGSNYPTGQLCVLDVIGDAKCTPQIACPKFDFRPSECDNEHVEVLNSIQKSQKSTKLCGSTGLAKPFIARKIGEASGLHISMRTSNKKQFDRIFNGFYCQVSCVEDQKKPPPPKGPASTTKKPPIIPVPKSPATIRTTTIAPPPQIEPTIQLCSEKKRHDLAKGKERTLIVKSLGYATGSSYPTGQTCTLDVIGNDSCTPQVVCPHFDFRERECEKEHLEIFNGIQESGRTSSRKLCSSTGITKPYIARKIIGGGGTSGLHIVMKTSRNNQFSRVYKGFFCNVTCAEDEEKPGAPRSPIPSTEPTTSPTTTTTLPTTTTPATTTTTTTTPATTTTPRPPPPPIDAPPATPKIQLCSEKKKYELGERKNKTVIVQSIDYATGSSYPTGQTCTVDVFGSDTCTPQVVCPYFDFRPRECTGEHVQIFNGIKEIDRTSSVKLCGSTGIPKPYVARKIIGRGTSGFHIMMKTSRNSQFGRVFNGFYCKITCVEDENKPPRPEPTTTTSTTEKPPLTTTPSEPTTTTTTTTTAPTSPEPPSEKPTRSTTPSPWPNCHYQPQAESEFHSDHPTADICTSPEKNLTVQPKYSLMVHSTNYIDEGETIENYPNGKECKLFIYGNEECLMSVTCWNMDLRRFARDPIPDNDCSRDYLEISDGYEDWRNKIKLCHGTLLREPFNASFNLENGLPNGIGIRFKTDPAEFDHLYDGFMCLFACQMRVCEDQQDKMTTTEMTTTTTKVPIATTTKMATTTTEMTTTTTEPTTSASP